MLGLIAASSLGRGLGGCAAETTLVTTSVLWCARRGGRWLNGLRFTLRAVLNLDRVLVLSLVIVLGLVVRTVLVQLVLLVVVGVLLVVAVHRWE